MNIFEIKNVNIYYGGKEILRDMSIDVKKKGSIGYLLLLPYDNFLFSYLVTKLAHKYEALYHLSI